jgi:hypothetical protein
MRLETSKKQLLFMKIGKKKRKNKVKLKRGSITYIQAYYLT